MAHHRFIAVVDLTVAIPNPGNEPAAPADQTLIDNIAAALEKTVKVQYNDREYTVEKVKKNKKNP
ncbi:MAG: hypothetical protein E6I83_05775 [Chloroflexi bacterium]|nr:MAG: hypothetical protein E6I83_05775 [Chloroflexota bacterium]